MFNNTIPGGTSSTRPFGAAVLDGSAPLPIYFNVHSENNIFSVDLELVQVVYNYRLIVLMSCDLASREEAGVVMRPS